MTLKEQLILHEGLRLKPYRCTSGRLTIGVGRNLDDSGITKDESMILLEHDIVSRYRGLRAALPFFDRLDDNRQRVLVDMAFMGLQKLLGFHDMLAAMEVQDWVAAEREMRDSKWARQVQAERVENCAKLMRGESI